MSLSHYQQQLSRLKMDRSSGHAKPHKVCLLLAIIDLIDRGIIINNKIYFNDELKNAFTKYFDQFKHGNDKDDPSQPFFYLESSGFWHHKIKDGCESEYKKRIKDRKHGSDAIISRIIDCACLDDELFQYMKSPIARTVILAALRENIEDLEKRFERWALGVGKSEKTVKNYIGAISSSISNWVAEAGIADKNLFEINSYKDFYEVADKAKKLEIFGVRDSKGKGMYSSALKLYGEFLSDTTQYEVGEDIENIQQDKTLDSTEKAILVNTRIGQGQFRQDLINYWGGCAVTGFKNPRLLVASHVKPWRASDNRERLDVFNGILLLPNLDKAFDLGYITFREDGRVLVSELLDEQGKLGIGLELSVTFQECHQDYLAYHREAVFKRG